jgi:hypothetical protein
VTFVKVFDRVTKVECFVDVQKMMRVFVEPADPLRREPPTEGEDEIVVRKLALDVTVRDCDPSFHRIDPRDFGFNKVHTPVKHRVSQIERDVFDAALAERQPHEGWVKDETAAARNERDLMIVAQLRSQPFRRYKATESTTK